MASDIRLVRRTVLLYVRDVLFSGESIPVVEGYTLPNEDIQVPSIAVWVASRRNSKYGLGGSAIIKTYDCILDIFTRNDGERDTLGGRVMENFVSDNVRLKVPTALASVYDANPGSLYGDLLIEHDFIRGTPVRDLDSGNIGRRHQHRIECIMTLIKE